MKFRSLLISCVFRPHDLTHEVYVNHHSVKCDYGVGLSRMMTGNVVASERPGHSILEGMPSFPCSDNTSFD